MYIAKFSLRGDWRPVVFEPTTFLLNNCAFTAAAMWDPVLVAHPLDSISHTTLPSPGFVRVQQSVTGALRVVHQQQQYSRTTRSSTLGFNWISSSPVSKSVFAQEEPTGLPAMTLCGRANQFNDLFAHYQLVREGMSVWKNPFACGFAMNVIRVHLPENCTEQHYATSTMCWTTM